MKIVFAITFAAVIVVSSIAGIDSLRDREIPPESEWPLEANMPTTPSTEPLSSPAIIGWVAFWDEQAALIRLQDMIDDLSVFAPALYRLSPDAQLERYTVVTREQLLALARNHDIPLTPTIGDEGDDERVSLLLSQQDIRQRFIDRLIEEAHDQGFSGWNLDIEAIEGKDRDAVSEFITRASEALHRENLTLSVVVFGKIEKETYDPARAYDFPLLAQTVDQVQIMAYNYNNDHTPPGGQAPLNWYQDVLRYALATLPRNKIVIGLSTHGYEWEGQRVRGLTYAEAERRISEVGAQLHYSDEHLANVITFQESPRRIVYYEDTRSILDKVRLAREYEINSFALWRIGAEDPQVWEALKTL